MAGTIAVRLFRPIAEAFSELLEQWRLTREPLQMGPYRLLDLDEAWKLRVASAEARGALPPSTRWDWKRKRYPIYTDAGFLADSVTVDVPNAMRFRFSSNVPHRMPQVMIARTGPSSPTGRRASLKGLPRPSMVMSVTYPPQHKRPEENRRRKDQKVPGFYERGLQLVNRTWGPVSEGLEVYHAFSNNPANMDAVVTALAINEAVDRAYGYRAELLRRFYRSGYWPFPVGYDMLSRLWET